MRGRRFWAIANFLLAALNFGLCFSPPEFGWVHLPNMIVVVALTGLGLWHLGASPPHLTTRLVLPQIDQLPDHLFPEAVAVREARERELQRELLTKSGGSPSSRALSLLLSHLTPMQQKEYIERLCFTFKAPSGKWFRLHPTTYYGVQELDSGGKTVVQTYCAYPAGTASPSLPAEDGLLGTYLLLLSDEKQFFRIANAGGVANTGNPNTLLAELSLEERRKDFEAICVLIDQKSIEQEQRQTEWAANIQAARARVQQANVQIGAGGVQIYGARGGAGGAGGVLGGGVDRAGGNGGRIVWGAGGGGGGRVYIDQGCQCPECRRRNAGE